jgi:transposase-like protein
MQKVLLALQLRWRESYESWLDFGRDLTKRAMRAPALVIADEGSGDLEGHPRAVARRNQATLHSPRPQEHHLQAARAPPPRA